MTTIIILAIYLGFTAFWGRLLTSTKGENRWLALLFAIFLILPASLGLPWDGWGRLAAWFAGLVMTTIYVLRPVIFPDWLWGIRFAYGYFGAVMFLILAWSAISGQLSFLVWMGLPSGWAGVLGLRRAILDGRT